MYYKHANCDLLGDPVLTGEFNTATAGVVTKACRNNYPSCSLMGTDSTCGSIVTQVTVAVPKHNKTHIKQKMRQDILAMVHTGNARFLVNGTLFSLTDVFPITKAIQLYYGANLAEIAPTATEQTKLLGQFAQLYAAELFLDASFGSLSISGAGDGFFVSITAVIDDLSSFSLFEGMQAVATKALAEGKLDATFSDTVLVAAPVYANGSIVAATPATATATSEPSTVSVPADQNVDEMSTCVYPCAMPALVRHCPSTRTTLP